MFAAWLAYRTLGGDKEYINISQVIAMRFDANKTRMRLLLRNGAEVTIIIHPAWREVIEEELFGSLKTTGIVVDLTEPPPSKLSPEESELLDKIISEALFTVAQEQQEKEQQEKEGEQGGEQSSGEQATGEQATDETQ